MEITLKHLSDTKVHFTISVGPKELAEAEELALVKLAKNVKVAGFRPGKVPLSVAEKNVDPAALQEQTLDSALNRAVVDAFLKEGIQALDRPQVEVKKFVPSELLEFTAEVEIIPKITLGDYKKLSARPETATVTAKEVDEIIERMRAGFSEKKEVKRAAQNDDEVIIDFVGKKEGVAFEGGTAADYTLKLGASQFIPGFEEGIVGHKAGEPEFDLELSFPEDYHAKELAGTKVTFSVTLKKVLELSLPEVNDELAAKAGPFTSVAELKADIKREITAQKDREIGEKFKDALIGELIEKSTVAAPEILLADQMSSIERDFMQNLAHQGLELDSYLNANKFKDIEEWREKEVRPTALRRVQAGLVLAEVTKAEAISATDDEITEHVEVHKTQYLNNPEVLKQFETDEVRRDIANHYITEKTLGLLLGLNGGASYIAKH